MIPESTDLLDFTHQPKQARRKWIRSTSVPQTRPDSLVEKMKLKFQQHLEEVQKGIQANNVNYETPTKEILQKEKKEAANSNSKIGTGVQ